MKKKLVVVFLPRGNKKGGEVCKIQRLTSECGINAKCKKLNDSKTMCICNKYDDRGFRYRPKDKQYTGDEEACRKLWRYEKDVLIKYPNWEKLFKNMENDEYWHNSKNWEGFEDDYNRYAYRQQDLDERTNNYGMGYR